MSACSGASTRVNCGHAERVEVITSKGILLPRVRVTSTFRADSSRALVDSAGALGSVRAGVGDADGADDCGEGNTRGDGDAGAAGAACCACKHAARQQTATNQTLRDALLMKTLPNVVEGIFYSLLARRS
jgi:hypothetical protein